MERRRAVITGLGAVTALGGARELWDSLKAGQSGIRRLESISGDHFSVKIAGEVRGFDPRPLIDHKEARRMGRSSQFAVLAAKAAVEDAGYTFDSLAEEGERVGVVIGTTMGPHDIVTSEITKYATNGQRTPNPILFINCLPNMPAHYVSRYAQAYGHLSTPSAACASGAQAVGEAVELIRAGRCEMVIAGGVEAILIDHVMAGFEAMRALAMGYNDQPEAASRPFDADRCGFVLSEGCGLLLVEELEHALRRGARIYAEVLGHATSSDAYHIAALDPQGSGAIRVMRWALQDARLNPADVDYINAHGTSTPANDVMETQAIKTVFGDVAYQLPISSTKSMIGHAMGASGAIELIACALSLTEGVIHPTINYHTPDPECDLDYVPNNARDAQGMRVVMSNSFGLGGQNACVILGALDAHH